MNCALTLFLFFYLFINLGCTSVYYLPNQQTYPYFKAEKYPPEDIFFKSTDGTLLHAWHFKADPQRCAEPKGLVLHYHGNAENLSSHYRILHWLTEECYDYYIFDYRSYGISQGSKEAAGILTDARAALNYFANISKQRNLKLITYGQSIGGTLLLRSLQLEAPPPELKAVIIESSFYKYTQIGREKLSSFWLTWPFQPLAYLLISNEASPGGRDFSSLKGLPKLLIYSEDDFIVPLHHGTQLFAEMPEPKWFWSHPQPGHINSMFIESGKYRKRLINWLNFQ